MQSFFFFCLQIQGIIFKCFTLMNECLLIFFSLRKESLLLTVVDMRDQCSERNLRISKSNCGKNHVDYT